jgi:septum site-determining protein MinD
MEKVIVITSGKGGVGKTTTSANIGAGLASSGKSVVLIDTDIGLRNLDVVLGLENRIVYDLVDVVEGTCKLKQALIRDKRFDNLYLLPAAQTRDKNAVAPDQMKVLVGQLEREFDYVIIDCPAGIERGFKNATAGARSAIVVTVPEVSSVRDADRIIGLLSSGGISDVKLLINRIRPELVKRGDMLAIEDTLEILGVDLIGVVPEDEMIFRASNLGEPAVCDKTSKAGEAFMNVTRRILGEEVPLMKLEAQGGFVYRLKNLFASK